MYQVESWDNKTRIIKRLSKYEKRILFCLVNDVKMTKIKKMREVIRMPHSSSMSRVIKTLEEKGLILTRPREPRQQGESGIYKKRISLTPAGKKVAIKVNNEISIEEAEELEERPVYL